MKSYTVLIADDEPNARIYLNRLLSKDEEVNLLKECKNGKEVVLFLEKIQPDIIFLDVEMPGITGLEVAEKLSENTILIFTTAFEEYALDAFKFRALDYLLKPFDEERFFKTLNRAKEQVQKNKQQELTQKLLSLIEGFKEEDSSGLRFIEIKKRGFLKKIPVGDIIYIEAQSVYVELHTKDEKELYRASLQDLEKKLPDFFLRIHRALIINKSTIEEVRYNNNNTYDFSMINGASLTSGRTYKEAIMESF